MVVLDVETFWENYSELKEILPHLIGQFKRSYPENIKKIQAALEKKDSDALKAAAHGLKGMLLQLYAPDSAILALQLEVAGKTKNIDTAPELLRKLIGELGTLDTALTELLKANSAA